MCGDGQWLLAEIGTFLGLFYLCLYVHPAFGWGF